MKPRLLDLFCGAGGAAMGYHRAGFEVVGVDINPHPDFPFEIIKADALDVLRDVQFVRGFHVRHASPPCQAYTTMSNRRRLDHPDLIPEVRSHLRATSGLYVLENVPGARSSMDSPITLRGGMFGLGVDRPRLFEINALVLMSTPERVSDPVGVYGARPDGRRLWTRADGSEQRAARSLSQAAAAMGIDWMTDWADLTESIPPAYTEHLGHQLMAYIREEATAK